MLHSFLLIGQSNMAGRGLINEVPLIYNHHIKMLRNGRWQTMWEPIHYDRPNAGIGLAASFAAAWQSENPNREIGLIPCADGGTSLDDWNIDGALFQNALAQAKIAQKTSNLKGILWHQGENDSQVESAEKYGEKFAVIVKKLREELGAEDIPLVIGGLGDFLTKGSYGAYFKSYPKVNEELQKFAHTTANCYFVTASGLNANPDNIHINAESQRIFGIRYFEGFERKQHILQPLENETNILKSIYKRELTLKEQKELLAIQFSLGELTPEEYTIKVSALQ